MMKILEMLVVLALVVGILGLLYASFNLAILVFDAVCEIVDRIGYIKDERKQRRRNEVEK